MTYLTAENCQLVLAAFGVVSNAQANHGKALYWAGVVVLTLGLKLMKG